MTPQAVIFDCDGVLVDSEAISFEVVRDDLAAHGLALSYDEFGALFHGGTMPSAGDALRAMGAPIPDDWAERTYEKVYARLELGVEKVAGIDPLLDALEARNIPMAVGSNGAIRKMQITLGQTGLWQRFEGRIFSAKVLGVAKPAPDLFLHAAAQIGVAPSDCVVVEDSPSGCIAARRAGMRCYGFAERTAPARLSAEGAIPVASMVELMEQLGL